jgi:hypothetical protein
MPRVSPITGQFITNIVGTGKDVNRLSNHFIR